MSLLFGAQAESNISTSQSASVSSKKSGYLILFWEKGIPCCENRMKHINAYVMKYRVC